MKNKVLILCMSMLVMASCKSLKDASTTTTSKVKADTTATAPEIPAALKIYRASNTVTNDINHIKIEVSFDWVKKWMYGKATLTVKPRFYATSHLDLNARGMQINEVCIVSNSEKKPLTYTYENDSLKITLDRPYTRKESYKIFVDYIAKPDELKSLGGSAAISSDKGLYFINADGKIAGKQQQIWTQGETQSNQVWMPIIDSPNQRMTQEISMTVDTAFVTLSNGLMVSTIVNDNGTRTDVWKQSLPAAPYLSMMAVGKFAIIKDSYKDIEVNYYVYPEYAADGQAIFGNTPEMIQFFSEKLIPYPWEKYSQVIGEDYVSGAMENTTATLHGSYVQQHKREMIDGTQEDVISHELFHQWFGDYVTCESWSNIPLNESFATYGEYLWNEHKYGRDAADKGLQSDLGQYLSQASNNDADLIRFYYENREDMFDGISYQKGGRVLHMLRKYVGDDAFFASLQDYLNTNKFSAVEAHNLRLAFEKTTGEDLNWFWNQWFFNKGFPILEMSYEYNDSAQQQLIYTQQKQDLAENPLYKLPVYIDFYFNGKAERKRVTLTSVADTFAFDMPVKPEFINFDAEKMLLCKKTDNHSKSDWTYMLVNCPLYLDRFEGLTKIGNPKPGTPEAKAIMHSAQYDNYYGLRNKSINGLKELAKSDAEKAQVEQLLLLKTQDPKSAVRSNAINKLSEWYSSDTTLLIIYRNAITTDSSYLVIGSAVAALADQKPTEGLAVAQKLEQQNDNDLNSIVADVYADHGDDANIDFMVNYLKNAKGFEGFSAMSSMQKYLKRCQPQTVEKAIPVYENIAKNDPQWFIKLQATNQLTALAKENEKQIDELKTKVAEAKKVGITPVDFENKIITLTNQKIQIENLVTSIKKDEKDERLKKIYSGETRVSFDRD